MASEIFCLSKFFWQHQPASLIRNVVLPFCSIVSRVGKLGQTDRWRSRFRYESLAEYSLSSLSDPPDSFARQRNPPSPPDIVSEGVHVSRDNRQSKSVGIQGCGVCCLRAAAFCREESFGNASGCLYFSRSSFNSSGFAVSPADGTRAAATL